MVNSMDKLTVYDGSHLLHRGYHVADSKLSSEYGGVDPKMLSDLTIFTILRSILCRKETEESIVLLFDAPSSTTYRKNVNPEYKANRSEKPHLYVIKDRLVNYLNSINLKTIQLDGLEADDIAYIMSRDLKNPINFITDDKDWFSCIRSEKTVYRPCKDELISVKELYDWYRPYYSFTDNVDEKILSEITLYRKALFGDSSDNIQGFNGIGEKRSHKVIRNILKLESEGKSFRDYEATTSYESVFTNDFDKFESNLKVLGYSHLDGVKLQSIFTPYLSKDEVSENYRTICDELDSSTLRSTVRYYNKLMKLHEPKLEFN